MSTAFSDTPNTAATSSRSRPATNANVISHNVRGEPTAFTYDRNRLMSAKAHGTEVQHHYDAYGRASSTTGAGEVVERNTYDGFDHVVKNQRTLPVGD